MKRRMPLVALLALTLISCATLVPNGSGPASLEGIGVAPVPARLQAKVATKAFVTRPLTNAGGVLRAPEAARWRALPPDQSCPALADPGFTARCGLARTADGAVLVWLVQSRVQGKGLYAQVLRPAEDRLDIVLEVVDKTGSRFDDIRATVADITGDGNDEIAMSFYRRGASQVLALDVVQWPGVVALHREYVQGSARATAGRLEGWEAVPDPRARTSLLTHEVVTFADGEWRRTATSVESGAVYGQDFADPYLLKVGNRYYGYSTNRGPSNVPLITSTDLASWYSLPDALPRLPAWTTRGRVWAPSVLHRPDGYVLYYTTREQASGFQCISRARAAAPTGPFVDESTEPLVCQRDLNGSIDPSPFVDADGTPYLLWKSEGVPGRAPSRLWSQPLSRDGLSLVGSPVSLLSPERGWEEPLIEGPALVRDGGQYHLFYSAGRWQTSSYAIGWATCSSPQGPCTKPTETPLVASAGDLTGPGGPGGAEVLSDAGGIRWLAFHAWVPFEGGYPAGRRMLHLTPLRFRDGQPILGGPDVCNTRATQGEVTERPKVIAC